MKTSNLTLVFAALTLGFEAKAQTDMPTDVQDNSQSTNMAEVPGDNFSLEGALELFKKSSSPEEFERTLNSPDSKVNNLDLNNDNNIDYIKVIDYNEGNIHAFVLQAVISPTESQDVAVIELQKLDDGKATLQITGDADIYGVDTIIEPSSEVRVNAGTSTARVGTNVWTWPVVQYVYAPYYNPWMSPWSWSYYPIWWRPWSPVAFSVYNPWWTPYRPYYSFSYSHRMGYLPRLYAPYRRSSRYVYDNYHVQVNNYRSRHYATNNGGSRHNNRLYYGDRHYSGYGNNVDQNGSNSNGYGRGRVDTRGYQHYQGYQGYNGRHYASPPSGGFSNAPAPSVGGRGFSHSGWQSSGSSSGGGRSHFGARSGGFHSGGSSGGNHFGGAHSRGR